MPMLAVALAEVTSCGIPVIPNRATGDFICRLTVPATPLLVSVAVTVRAPVPSVAGVRPEYWCTTGAPVLPELVLGSTADSVLPESQASGREAPPEFAAAKWILSPWNASPCFRRYRALVLRE